MNDLKYTLCDKYNFSLKETRIIQFSELLNIFLLNSWKMLWSSAMILLKCLSAYQSLIIWILFAHLKDICLKYICKNIHLTTLNYFHIRTNVYIILASNQMFYKLHLFFNSSFILLCIYSPTFCISIKISFIVFALTLKAIT